MAPANVTVRNQGGEPAEPFKISVERAPSGGSFPFTVQGQESIWYPATTAPLAPGDSLPFSGEIVFTFFQPGETISVLARADSCAGEEFTAPYCRVDESNENNNVSSQLPITMPGQVSQADLVVSAITAIDVECPQGVGSCVTTADITIVNEGDGDAGPFVLSATFDPNQSVNVHRQVSGLAAGASETFTFETPPGGNCFDSDCTVCALVDSRGQLDELSEDNNSLCQTRIG